MVHVKIIVIYLIVMFVFSCQSDNVLDKICKLSDWGKTLEVLYTDESIIKDDYILLKYYILKNGPKKVCGECSFRELIKDAESFRDEKHRIYRFPTLTPNNLAINVLNDGDKGEFGSGALSFRVQANNTSKDSIHIKKMNIRFFSPLGRWLCMASYKTDTIIGGYGKFNVSKQFSIDRINDFLFEDKYQFWEFENRSLIYSNIAMDCQIILETSVTNHVKNK